MKKEEWLSRISGHEKIGGAFAPLFMEERSWLCR